MSPIRQLERASSLDSWHAHGASTSSSTIAPRGYPPPRSATPRDSPAPAEPSVPVQRPVGTARSNKRPSAADARPSAARYSRDGNLPPPPSRPTGHSTAHGVAPADGPQHAYRAARDHRALGTGSRPIAASTGYASDHPRARARTQREDGRPAPSATRNEPAHAHAQRGASPTRAVSPRRYEQAPTRAHHTREAREDEPPACTISPRSHARAVVRAHHQREAQAAKAAWRAHQARYSTALTRPSGGPARASTTRRGAETTGERESTTAVSTSSHQSSRLPRPAPPSPRARSAHPLSHDSRVPVARSRRPSPSPAPPAHRARARPADAIQPACQYDTPAFVERVHCHLAPPPLPGTPTPALRLREDPRARPFCPLPFDSPSPSHPADLSPRPPAPVYGRRTDSEDARPHRTARNQPDAADEDCGASTSVHLQRDDKRESGHVLREERAHAQREHPRARAVSPQSRARALVHRHQECEARAAKQAEGSPMRSSGGLAHASAKGREVESTGGREDMPAVSIPMPQLAAPHPPAPGAQPSRIPSPPQRTRPAHSLSCNTLSPVERAHHRSVPPPLSSALAPTSRQGVDRPVRQAPHWHANGAHGVHIPLIGAPSDVRTSLDSARPAAASRPGPSTTSEMSSSGDPRRDGCRAARDHRAPGSLSSPASSSRADRPARANAHLLDVSDPSSSRKPVSASAWLPRHSSNSWLPSRPLEQAALAPVERDHRRLAAPSSRVPALRKQDGPPMCQAPLPHAVGTLGRHAPPSVVLSDARASPDSAHPAAVSRPDLSIARKMSSWDNLRDGCWAVRDHRSPGSLPSSASSCRPVLVSTLRLSHPPDSLASIPPSRKEEPDLAGLDEELRRRIWQVRARSRLVTEDSPESAAIAEEEAALRREIWQARARARLAPRLV